MLGLSAIIQTLVVGVYIGFDNPKTLGKYETGSKAAFQYLKILLKEFYI